MPRTQEETNKHYNCDTYFISIFLVLWVHFPDGTLHLKRNASVTPKKYQFYSLHCVYFCVPRMQSVIYMSAQDAKTNAQDARCYLPVPLCRLASMLPL